MTRLTRKLALCFVCAAAVAALTAGCGSKPASEGGATSAPSIPVTRGGELLASIRTDPQTFNRYTQRDSSTLLVATLTQAPLVRLNRVTQEIEPWLAEKWSVSDHGQTFTLTLRRDVVFSDGHPFTADDVLFSFAAAYDDRTGGPLTDALKVAGKKLEVKATDPHTVVIRFPVPFAPGLRILDNLPILPRHTLEAAFNAGTFAKAWSTSTPPADLAGLGPFVLAEYTSGQRLVFTRNPRYFRRAPDGGPLPYLDRVTLDIIPDASAELLRLESGQLDSLTSEISSEAYAPIKRAADAGTVKLLDLGVSYNADALWFNLKPGALGNDPRAAWLQRDELRRAISMAVDRKVYADTVFLGAGVPVYGPETPANTEWFWNGPVTPYDPAGAKLFLTELGLEDRNHDGILEDKSGRPARFTVLTQKGRPNLERGAKVISDELKKVGLQVDVVTLDAGAIYAAVISAHYDAVFFNTDKTDSDPAINPDYWLSSGSAHFWNLEQKTPATEWERQLDALMAKQSASADHAERKRLYDEMQKIFAQHLPMLYFAAPRIYVAHSTRMTNLTPSVWRPQLLWSPDTIAVTSTARKN
ncbi:MAG: ABC transporter substrate-binding protein [Acidobacteriia bacterium]|nr:ABC transporter substrate-binding protein [Terriglobia bacterium]